jgi:hypothetical protein
MHAAGAHVSVAGQLRFVARQSSGSSNPAFAVARHSSGSWNPAFAVARHSSERWNPAFTLALLIFKSKSFRSKERVTFC